MIFGVMFFTPDKGAAHMFRMGRTKNIQSVSL